jgi:hypothetical protein
MITFILIVTLGLSVVNFIGLMYEIKERAKNICDVYGFIGKHISQVYTDLRR